MKHTLMDYVRGTSYKWWLRFKIGVYWRLRGSRLYGERTCGATAHSRRRRSS